MQWRIQGFRRGGGGGVRGESTPEGGTNLLFDQNFPKTAWKWKKFGPEWDMSLATPLDPQL